MGEQRVLLSVPDEVQSHFQPFITGFTGDITGPPDHRFTVTKAEDGYRVEPCDGRRVDVRSAGDTVLIFEKDLIRLLAETLDDRFMIVHASGVRGPSGTILFVGAPDAGKTRSLERILDQGGKVISDEMIGWDPTSSEIQPFPRPLNIPRPSKQSRWYDDFVVRDGAGQEYYYGTFPASRATTRRFRHGRMMVVLLNADVPDQPLEELAGSEAVALLLPHILRPRQGQQRFQHLSKLGQADVRWMTLGTEKIEQAVSFLGEFAF